ncbi:GCN5-like N-acetyltransferase [Thozetella sp. PMI_491]|nr:GCN5-like N-acetyltransferase [Thozetella sp. PMI_491]
MASPGNAQAILHTKRLRLEPLSEKHLDYLVQLDADPEVMRFVGNGRPRTRDEVIPRFRDWISRAGPVPGLGLWAGFLRSDSACGAALAPAGEFVGWWTLQPPMRPHQGGPARGQAELGYRLMRKFWRQGFAKEGAGKLVRHGFQDLDLERIFAETMAINEGSRATMASVGLAYKRTFHLSFGEDTIPGTEHGEVEYDITREQWQSRESRT